MENTACDRDRGGPDEWRAAPPTRDRPRPSSRSARVSGARRGDEAVGGGVLDPAGAAGDDQAAGREHRAEALAGDRRGRSPGLRLGQHRSSPRPDGPSPAGPRAGGTRPGPRPVHRAPAARARSSPACATRAGRAPRVPTPPAGPPTALGGHHHERLLQQGHELERPRRPRAARTTTARSSAPATSWSSSSPDGATTNRSSTSGLARRNARSWRREVGHRGRVDHTHPQAPGRDRPGRWPPSGPGPWCRRRPGGRRPGPPRPRAAAPGGGRPARRGRCRCAVPARRCPARARRW